MKIFIRAAARGKVDLSVENEDRVLNFVRMSEEQANAISDALKQVTDRALRVYEVEIDLE